MTCAILTFRNVAFKVSVLERVIVGSNCQATDGRIHGGNFCYGPTLEDAVGFQTQVVVKPPGVMLLDDKDRMLVRLARLRLRFGGFAEVPLAPVISQ